MGTGCTLVCWSSFDVSQNMAVPDDGPPKYPIQCDVNYPCGADPTKCVDMAGIGAFTAKAITSSVRIR